MRLSSNIIGDDETNFPHSLLLTNRQRASLCKPFANKSSANIKFLKTQLSKIIQLGRFLGRLLGPLMKNVVQSVAKSVLIPLGLTAAASAADAGILKKIIGSGITTLIISNEEMDDIMKIVKSLEDSALLLKGFTKTIEKEAKAQRGGFLSMLLGILGASLLGNLSSGSGVIRAGDGEIRAYNGMEKERIFNTASSSD